MYTLQIEHGITDFGRWKSAFDRDPVNRAASGVTAHRISRPVDDPHYVVVELDFERRAEAEELLANLQANVWNSSAAAPALRGEPKTRILASAPDTPAGGHPPPNFGSYATASASRTVAATAAAPAAPMMIV